MSAKSTNPFAKAQKEAEKHPVSANSTPPETGVFDQAQFPELCAHIEKLIETDPLFAGLAVNLSAVENAGASSKGSIRLGTWSRMATPEAKAANIVAYRSGKIVCTNVPLAPVLAL